MVFLQHCFHLEKNSFHLDRQFSCYSYISNWLSWIPTQSSLVIQKYFSSWLSCTLSLSMDVNNLVGMRLHGGFYKDVIFQGLQKVFSKVIVCLWLIRIGRESMIRHEVLLKLRVSFCGMVISKEIFYDYIRRIETYLDVVVEIIEFQSSVYF